MAEYDLRSGQLITPALHPISNGTGANGVSIDTKGYESVTFNVSVGAIASGTITFSLESADDNGSGSPGAFTSVAAADVIGTLPTFSAANQAGALGYRGKRQWVRIVSAGTYTTCVHAANCTLGNPKRI